MILVSVLIVLENFGTANEVLRRNKTELKKVRIFGVKQTDLGPVGKFCVAGDV